MVRIIPEKLIPLAILNAIEGKPIPVYGRGDQIRDWLYVEDHARALVKVVFEGIVGETYNIGGHNERTNRQVVETLCDLLGVRIEQKPRGLRIFRKLIRFVADRPVTISVMQLMHQKLTVILTGYPP